MVFQVDQKNFTHTFRNSKDYDGDIKKKKEISWENYSSLLAKRMEEIQNFNDESKKEQKVTKVHKTSIAQ